MFSLIDRLLLGSAAQDDRARPLSAVLVQCRRSLVLVGLLTMAVQIMAITPILFAMNAFDRVMSSRSEVTLISLLSLVLVAYGFWSALEWIRSRLMIRLSLRIDWETAIRTFDAAFRSSTKRHSVDVHQAMNDVVTLRQFMTGAPLLALMSAPYAVVFVAIGWLFHPYLALFVVGATLLQAAAIYATTRMTTQALREATQASANANRCADILVRQAQTALPLGMQGSLRRTWYAQHQRFLTLQVNASESSGLIGGFNAFLTHALPSLQIALGIFLAIEGQITGGMVMVAGFLINQAIKPLSQVMTAWPQIQGARMALDRLNALLAQDPGAKARMELPRPTGQLQVQAMSYTPHQAHTAVLTGLNFTLQPGDALVVIGPSGAGKTTLLKVLVGLIEPTRGFVRLDGAQIAPWILHDLGQYIGYVSQDIELFDGTVAENIARLGQVDSQKVVQAARECGMHEMILAMPNGYETILSTRPSPEAHVLTGGQKQRLAIARALYAGPTLVVMDEPSAHLDDAAESALIAAIQTLRERGACVVFSTHRPKMIPAASHVLALKDGHQVAFGRLNDVVGEVSRLQAGAEAASLRDGRQEPSRTPPHLAA